MKKVTFIFSVSCFLIFAGNNLFAQCCGYTSQQQVEPLTSAATFGVALGDFDNDGDLDAVAISAYYGIDVYFNNGSGTYTLSAQYATSANHDFYGVHVADVDGDGDKDIIAIPFYTTSNLTILKNNGSGIFTVTEFPTNISTYNAAVGDIDGDGDIDVLLPNAGGGAGKVLKNNGTGSYSIFQTLTGARGHDAALGDLDGDGKLDAFVTENSSYGNTVFLNNGTGTFTQMGTNFGTDGGQVALGDLDGDGDKDAWVGTGSNNSEIWINNGSGVFTLDTTIITGSYCKAINFYDKDGDGDLDVFLGFYSSNPQIWTNNGNLSFTLCYQATVGYSSHGQAIGDINNDGAIDIYSGYFSNDEGDFVFLNSGSSATILYTSNSFCSNLSTQQNVTLTGTTGGTFSSSPSGLAIDSATGTITPNTSNTGTYTVTYTVGGCPAITTVVIKSLDLTTTLSGLTITASQTAATYVWIDCTTNLPIAGETNQSFLVRDNGSYAVVITKNGCSDTSACTTVMSVGIAGSSEINKISVYPNPAFDQINVEVNSKLIGLPYSISDPLGRIILTGKIGTERSSINITELPGGLYLFKVGEQNHQSFKVMKQ